MAEKKIEGMLKVTYVLTLFTMREGEAKRSVFPPVTSTNVIHLVSVFFSDLYKNMQSHI